MPRSPSFFAALSALAVFLAPTAHALDPVCDVYLRAAEKSARQPARHSTTDTDGLRMEVIVVGGRSYSRVGGRWSMVNTDLLAAERALTSAIRAGRYPLTDCRKIGPSKIDGMPTTVYAYTLNVGANRGVATGETKAHIGADGLVYAQSTSDAEVHYRYRGVAAPEL